MRLAQLMVSVLLALVLGGAAAAPDPVPDSRVPVRVEVMASGLDHPWGLAFLPGGGVLVTERNGGLKRLESGKLFPVSGVPPVFNQGQGGLFDVLPHPDFNSNGLVFLSYAHGTNAANGTRVARAKLVGNSLIDVTPIYTAAPLKRGPVHFGGRMAFLPDGTIVLTTGDGFDFRERAQRLDSPLGKVMRISIDGKVPAGNPYASESDAQGAIWSRGHRNPQGLAYDPVRRMLFAHEHGPRGGDEVNVIRRGGNYGWPVVTLGMDYSGATISPFRNYPGMIDPVVSWVPSIAPSGLAVYRGGMFPEWQGSLLVGALVDKELRVVKLSPSGEPIGQERVIRNLGERIRDVRVAPDGAIWVTTDNAGGKVLRLTRAAG
jgi:glucose/arabinose dehydrogenase